MKMLLLLSSNNTIFSVGITDKLDGVNIDGIILDTAYMTDYRWLITICWSKYGNNTFVIGKSHLFV